MPWAQVRHRFYADEASLVRWCRQLTYLPEPSVLVITGHGETSGLTVEGRPIAMPAVVDALRLADSLKLLHFSACLVGQDASSGAQGGALSGLGLYHPRRLGAERTHRVHLSRHDPGEGPRPGESGRAVAGAGTLLWQRRNPRLPLPARRLLLLRAAPGGYRAAIPGGRRSRRRAEPLPARAASTSAASSANSSACTPRRRTGAGGKALQSRYPLPLRACRAHKSGRRSRVRRSDSARRHSAMRLWSPESSTSGMARPSQSRGRV